MAVVFFGATLPLLVASANPPAQPPAHGGGVWCIPRPVDDGERRVFAALRAIFIPDGPEAVLVVFSGGEMWAMGDHDRQWTRPDWVTALRYFATFCPGQVEDLVHARDAAQGTAPACIAAPIAGQ